MRFAVPGNEASTHNTMSSRRAGARLATSFNLAPDPARSPLPVCEPHAHTRHIGGRSMWRRRRPTSNTASRDGQGQWLQTGISRISYVFIRARPCSVSPPVPASFRELSSASVVCLDRMPFPDMVRP
ncbi:hypothetical protein IEO21_09702 [Rhodonia placenta]|uniref:Uncharacterized protein n=1 Tax=Rhodonia placenta TaxID=104341 RepID=A0A8H7NTZ4_9APHY|nr:hypothetical protein IEO21_09702 [Postia placenta]